MMWKICGGVTYNLHNCHRKTGLKVHEKKNKLSSTQRKKESARFVVRVNGGCTTNIQIPATQKSPPDSGLDLLTSSPYPKYTYTHSGKGKISSFPLVLDFKLICF